MEQHDLAFVGRHAAKVMGVLQERAAAGRDGTMRARIPYRALASEAGVSYVSTVYYTKAFRAADLIQLAARGRNGRANCYKVHRLDADRVESGKRKLAKLSPAQRRALRSWTLLKFSNV